MPEKIRIGVNRLRYRAETELRSARADTARLAVVVRMSIGSIATRTSSDGLLIETVEFVLEFFALNLAGGILGQFIFTDDFPWDFKAGKVLLAVRTNG